MITADKLFCRIRPHRAGVSFNQALVPAKSALWCVICGAGWVMLSHSLKLATRYVGSRGPWRGFGDVKVSHPLFLAWCCLVGATKWPLVDCHFCGAWRYLGEAILQTKAGCHLCQAWDFWWTQHWAEASCHLCCGCLIIANSGHCLCQVCGHLMDVTMSSWHQSLLVPGLGLFKQELQGTLKPHDACFSIVNLCHFLGKSTAQAKVRHLDGKTAGRDSDLAAWVGRRRGKGKQC